MSVQLPVSARRNMQVSLLRWFRKHRRDLPWRMNREAYPVWISEVMLQQTRIAAVVPYFRRFLERFSTVASLARAHEEEVLKLWSGLGYYSRARNLHRAAKQIVERHEGQFPRDLDEALLLPGIGRYTAAAVLSIAYDVPLAVLDGNVARVLARIAAIRGDLREPKRWSQLGEFAQQLLANKTPGEWNQSLMELGETVCTSRSPSCTVCPVRRYCLANARNLTHKIPQSRKKRPPVSMLIAAAVLCDARRWTLLVRNDGAHDDAIFSGMWQFPATEVNGDARAALDDYMRQKLKITGSGLRALPTVQHAVTFRNIKLLPFLAKVAALPNIPGTRMIPLSALGRLPISSATRKIAAIARTSS